MNVRIVNKSKHPLPHYQTEHAAGMDLTANIDGPITIRPLERAAVPTGIFIALPVGYEAQIRARSGLAAKHGISLANGIGTIDADYRGEIKALLVNLSKESYEINDGERIAQLVIAKYERIEWKEVKTLEKTARGKNGFGSTGK